jgi:hypothetical protein
MFQQKGTKRGKKLVTWFRTAILVTVLGLAVLAIEQPRLAASPNGQRATADAMSHQTVVAHGDATTDERTAAALLPASASEYAPTYAPAGPAASVNIAAKALESENPTPYFPAQFPPPKGEPEPLPPTF